MNFSKKKTSFTVNLLPKCYRYPEVSTAYQGVGAQQAAISAVGSTVVPSTVPCTETLKMVMTHRVPRGYYGGTITVGTVPVNNSCLVHSHTHTHSHTHSGTPVPVHYSSTSTLVPQSHSTIITCIRLSAGCAAAHPCKDQSNVST